MKPLSSILLVFTLVLSGCGGDEPAESRDQERLFDDQRRALEKAQQVEGMLQDAQQQRDEVIESQTAP